MQDDRKRTLAVIWLVLVVTAPLTWAVIDLFRLAADERGRGVVGFFGGAIAGFVAAVLVLRFPGLVPTVLRRRTFALFLAMYVVAGILSRTLSAVGEITFLASVSALLATLLIGVARSRGDARSGRRPAGW